MARLIIMPLGELCAWPFRTFIFLLLRTSLLVLRTLIVFSTSFFVLRTSMGVPSFLGPGCTGLRFAPVLRTASLLARRS